MKGDNQRGGWKSLRRPRSEGDFENSDFRKNDALLWRLDKERVPRNMKT